MSLDLTGITNANGFFTDYYLATLFEESVDEAVRAAVEAEQEGGAPAAHEALRATRTPFFRALDAYERASASEEREEQVAASAALLLGALGFDPAPALAIVDESGAAVPVWREYAGEDGAPQLQVLTVVDAAAAGEHDLFEGRVFAHGLEGAGAEGLPAGELGLEGAVGALFFEAPEAPRFVLAVGISQAALFDRTKWAEKRYLLFDLRQIHERREPSTYKAVCALLARASLVPASAESLLDAMERRSRANAQGVSDQLKYALRESVELLGNEVVYDWTHNQGKSVEELDAGELTIECLRYMYRMLFLLFMEARPELGFAPMDSAPYRSAYSLESLRDIAEAARASAADGADSDFFAQTLDRLCQMVYDGYPASSAAYRALQGAESTKGAFVIPPLKAHIFDAERTPLIGAARLRDSVLLKIVDLMSVAPACGRTRAQRISYATLGINQLGAVYEALLSYRGFIATEELFEVKKAGERFDELDVGYFVNEEELARFDEDERVRWEEGEREGELRRYPKGSFIYRLAGREREKSASYYTPESLTHCLVGHALEELLEGKSADEVLELTVLEPAMGSAAFLNEAVSQLAEAYLDRKQRELGREVPREERALALQRVKTYIADRNAFGIDLNPIAVELGEVSLWLNTVSADGYVPWFGNQLFCGNSLVGARRRGYTERELTSRAEGLRWYDREPARIGWAQGAGRSHRVYHFLTFDPGMARYTDKVARDLSPEGFEAAKAWNRRCKAPYSAEEVRALARLSAVVDDLWRKQIVQQRDVRARTQAALDVFGHEAPGAGSALTIREKDALYRSAYKSERARNAGPYARLKFAMDYWCALWFWPIDQAGLLPSRAEFLVDLSLILEGTVDAARSATLGASAQASLVFEEAELNAPEQQTLDALTENYGAAGEVDLERLCADIPRLKLAREVARRQRFFHWDLEFADTLAARGGFDLVLGNPPWIKLEWKEQGVLADWDPRFAVKGWSATETSRRRPEAFARHPGLAAAYLGEYASTAAYKTFLGAAQTYPLVKGQQANLYRNFLPQAFEHLAAGGAAGFVHPDTILQDTRAGALRREMLARYRKRFQFINELKLFAGVHNETFFSLNVYGSKQDSPSFDCIVRLYDPATIAACYAHDGTGPVPGVKDAEGRWNTQGHAARIIHMDERELRAFGALLGDEWEATRLLNVHAAPLMEVLARMAGQGRTLRDLEKQGLIETSVCWDETNSRRDGTLCDRVGFAERDAEVVYSGPFIGVGNPLYQGARRDYRNNSDYDPVDLTAIGADFRVRTKYARACGRAEYERRQPGTPWGAPFCAHYRLANREFVGCSSERTLMAAILPPAEAWVHTRAASGGMKAELEAGIVPLMAGCYASLPYDYLVRAIGKGHINYATTMSLPIPESPLNAEIRCRALLLNCLTKSYAPLWEESWDAAFAQMAWSRSDPRLSPERFSGLTSTWSWETPLRTDFERRQALVELDVLAALALGLTLEQLESVYRLDFSVLQAYEADTWYDRRGRTVFSPKKGATLYQLSRAEFERVCDLPGGTVERVFTDDTQPGGPRERTVEFEAPYSRCDRIADYRAAWAFFCARYGLEGGAA